MTIVHRSSTRPLRRSLPTPGEPRLFRLYRRFERTMLLATGIAGIVMLGLALASLAEDSRELAFIGVVGGIGLVFAGLRALELDRAQTRRQSELLMQALEGSRAGRTVCDEHGRPSFMNRAFTRLVGELPPDGSVLSALEQFFSGDAEGLAEFRRLRDIAAGGGTVVAELPHRGRGGQLSWRQVQARAVEGWPGFVTWRIEDVTSRHEIEVTIVEEQAKLSDFMENAPVGFYSVDQDGHVLFANSTLADWLGHEGLRLADGSLRLHDIMVDPPQDAPPYAILPLSEGGDKAEQRAEVLLRALDGSVMRAAIAQRVVSEADGSRLRTHSVVRDLTPERRMEHALALSERRFQRFFEDAPLGIVLLDAECRVIEANAFMEGLTGERPELLLGRPLQKLIAGGEDPALHGKLIAVVEGQPLHRPIELKLAGGQGRMVQLYARALERDVTLKDGASKDGPALILHLMDVTDQKSLEMQFVQSQKMQAIGQLAGGVAHDFNNLLTAMIGFCDLLLLRHKPGDHSFGDIMQIKQNANRAANLVRQLLAFSRQQTLQPRVLNMTDVLAELSNLLRRLIGENIELKIKHGRDVGPIKVDQGQLEQVIINLAVNARDAMDQGGSLTVSTHALNLETPLRRGHEVVPAGEWIAVDVTDTGTGIPTDVLERIFEPFFSTKEVGKGTGLGLSTVYGIVRQTGGYVLVNTEVGRGTTFSILLPRHHEVATEPTAADPEAEDKKRTRDLTGAGTILLVEDEDAVRVFGARALRNKGYEVLEARSGEEALDMLSDAELAVDLVVTDVVMPHMDGPTMIRHVRESRPDLKVIFISGYTEDRFRGNVDEEAGFEFLPKPFTLKQLAGKVKEVMQD